MPLAFRVLPDATAASAAEQPAGQSAKPVCLLLLLTLLPVLLVCNPLVLGVILPGEAAIEVVYVLFFDVQILALMGLCCLFIRTQNRVYFRAALLGLIALPVLLAGAEALILHFRADYQGLLGADSRPDVPKGALLRRDDRVGWSLRPNATAGPPRIVVDGEGRRQTPPPSNNVTTTIHAFGDSFLFGQGIPQRRNALNLLAERLHDQAGVLNYAVSGYGLEQMVLRLEAAAGDIKPGDLVLIVPITDDLRRNLVTKQQVCAHYQAGFASETFPRLVDGGWRFEDLRDHCPELGLPLTRLLTTLKAAIGLTERELVASADQVLLRAKRMTEAKGAAFALVFQPNYKECQKGRFDIDPAALSVPFTSLMGACADFDPAKDYMLSPTDYHWNKNGHRWLAEALSGVIEAKGLLGADASTSAERKDAAFPKKP